jgi:hypothetical protein
MTWGRLLYHTRPLLLLFLQLLLLLQPLPTHARAAAGVWVPRDTSLDENRTDLGGEGPVGLAPGGEDENRTDLGGEGPAGRAPGGEDENRTDLGGESPAGRAPGGEDENRTDLEGEGPAGRAPGGEDENRTGFYEASTFFYFCALLGVSFAGLLLLCGCCLCEARSLPRIVYGFGRGAALGPLPLHPPSRARTSVDFYTRG